LKYHYNKLCPIYQFEQYFDILNESAFKIEYRSIVKPEIYNNLEIINFLLLVKSEIQYFKNYSIIKIKQDLYVKFCSDIGKCKISVR